MQPEEDNHGEHRRSGAQDNGSSAGQSSSSSGSVTWSSIQDPSSWATDPSTGSYSFSLLRSKPERPAPRTIPYAGIRAGEIVGWRGWWLVDGMLCSLAHHFLWHPQEIVSGNLDEIVSSQVWGEPILGGIYSYCDNISNLLEWENWVSINRIWPMATPFGRRGYITKTKKFIEIPQYFSDAIIFGSISMWGDVIEHQDGYRAQYAKIRSLDG